MAIQMNNVIVVLCYQLTMLESTQYSTMFLVIIYCCLFYHYFYTYFSGKLVVIHQSPRFVKMNEGKIVVPVFCVASGHALDMMYTWHSTGKRVGTNSPVLWVSCPGTYKCTVTKGLRTCLSGLISVTGL